MNQNIKNPERHAKRTAERQERRTRPNYPALPSGRFTRVNREECGTTRRFFNEKSELLVGQFIFVRPTFRLSRSRYAPHVGKKQGMKAQFSAATIG